MTSVIAIVGFFAITCFIHSDVESVPYHDAVPVPEYILQVTIYDEYDDSLLVYETPIDTTLTVQSVYNTISPVVQKYYPNENVILEHDGIPITDPDVPFYSVASNYEIHDNYGRVGVKPTSTATQLWSANQQTNNVNNAINAPNTVINKETNIKRKHSERIRIHESSSSETMEEFVIPASSSSSEVSSPSSSTEESSSSYSSSSSSSSSSYSSSSSSSSYSSLSSMSSGSYEYPVCHTECTVTEKTTPTCTFTTACQPELGPPTAPAATGCPTDATCIAALSAACSTPGDAPLSNSGTPPTECTTFKSCAGSGTASGTALATGTPYDCSTCFPNTTAFPCP